MIWYITRGIISSNISELKAVFLGSRSGFAETHELCYPHRAGSSRRLKTAPAIYNSHETETRKESLSLEKATTCTGIIVNNHQPSLFWSGISNDIQLVSHSHADAFPSFDCIFFYSNRANNCRASLCNLASSGSLEGRKIGATIRFITALPSVFSIAFGNFPRHK